MTDPTPLDPAKIMAEHHGEPGGDCLDGWDCGYMWPCPTYRLAEALIAAEAALTAERAKVQRVEASVKRATIRQREISPRDLRIALAEGAAEEEKR